jgi:hypothetical protein
MGLVDRKKTGRVFAFKELIHHFLELFFVVDLLDSLN